MNDFNTQIEKLKNCIKEKVERSMDSPSDFDLLSGQIKIALKEYVSPTTLKRFYQYIHSNVSTRTSTLSLLSRYVGYRGWDDFCINYDNNKKYHNSNILSESSIDNISKQLDYELIHSSVEGPFEILKITKFGQPHAVKVLKKEFINNKELNADLKREFLISYCVAGPSTSPVIGFENVVGRGESIISRWIDGKSLRSFIIDNNPDKEQILEIIRRVCLAIDKIHAKGYSYNNLKLENVFIEGDIQEVRLLDFSNAKSLKESETDMRALKRFIIEINSLVSDKIHNINRLKLIDENHLHGMNSMELYKLLIPKNLIPLYIILSFVVALIICVGSIYWGNNYNTINTNKYSIFDVDETGGGKRSIVVFDTLSRRVIKRAEQDCCEMRDTLNRIPVNKNKSIKLMQWKNFYKLHISDYPSEVLDKYLGKDEHEYNLYKVSLIKLSEDIYNQFYNKLNDSIRTVILNEKAQERAKKEASH